MKAFDSFGSEEHVKSLSREDLEELFRYVFNSRETLNRLLQYQDNEITRLHMRVARQAHQLKEVQMALERRNQSELKPRWQRAMDKLQAKCDRYREVLDMYGIDPDEEDI